MSQTSANSSICKIIVRLARCMTAGITVLYCIVLYDYMHAYSCSSVRIVKVKSPIQYHMVRYGNNLFDINEINNTKLNL